MGMLAISSVEGDLLISLVACVGLLCLAVLALSIGFWRLGAEVVVRGRFPLHGARPERDVRLVRGEAALRFGRGLQFFSLAVPLACLCGAILAWRAYQALAISLS